MMDDQDQLTPADGTDAAPPTGLGDRAELIAVRLTSILASLDGIAEAKLDRDETFANLGFDSIFLTRAASRVRKEFGVRVTLRQLLNDGNTIGALALHLDAELGPGDFPADGSDTDAYEKPPIEMIAGDLLPPTVNGTAPIDDGESPTIAALAERIDTVLAPDALTLMAEPASVEHPTEREASARREHVAADEVERLIAEQLRLMEQQLDLMRLHVQRETRLPAPHRPDAAEKSE